MINNSLAPIFSTHKLIEHIGHLQHSGVTSIFFDLDGTISDPSQGFIQSVRRTFTELGLPLQASDEELKQFIGPPIQQSISKLLLSDDTDRIEEVIAKYRAHYITDGFSANTLYPHIPELLTFLQRQGLTLYIITNKVQPAAEKVIEHFELTSFFQAIYGTQPLEQRNDKIDIMQYALTSEAIEPIAVVMIGDRKEDILAAKANGVNAIGVTYGFGSVSELQSAGASFIV